jgi:PhoH-like ATPase
MRVILDTNVLMQTDIDLSQYEKVYLPIIVLEELDNHKISTDAERAFKARQAIRKIKAANNIESKIEGTGSLPTSLQNTKMDNRILSYAKDICTYDKDAVLQTYDYNMYLKAKSMGIPVVEIEEDNCSDLYTGYKEVILSEYDMALHYECPINRWDLLDNQYLIIKNEDGEIVDKQKWIQGRGFKNISYKAVDSRYVGKVKPRNPYQELYMDLLQDKETKVKVVQGDYGTGKDYLALSNFLQMVEKGNYEKIIWIRNNIEAEGTKPIGFLPGSLTEKLSVYAEIVGDFVGDKVGFEMLLNSGKLELVHAGFLRGRDLRNSIIYCTEAQNMPSSLVKLILSRISEGSIAFFNGDTKQIDDRSFKSNNGMNLMIEKLSGNPLFGYVKLETCERSEVAKLVKLLD